MLNHALLVDDSKSARFALRKLLERNGLRVDMAENAEQALGYLNNNQPDVIFLDHLMPGMDGFEALKILKNQPNTANIPVVMCTSKDGDAYTAEAQAIGAVDILSKPATPGSLEVVLSKLCQAANDQASAEPKQPAKEPSTEQLFEQVAGAYSVDQSEPETPVTKPVMPILEDVVVPVEEIKRVAAESAQEAAKQVADREIADRVAKQVAEKVPEMREMVMANFDSVVRSMLKGYIDEAMVHAKQDFAEIVREESRKIADEVSREVLDTNVAARVQALEDTLHREMNEHLTEVYTNIGELKANQHLKKASPELQQELHSQSREAAEEVSRETLAEASNVAKEAAERIAKDVAEATSQSTHEAVEAKMSSALENVNQVARTEAAEIAWQKVEESQKQVLRRVGSAKTVGILALLTAIAAIGIGFVL